jgi:hypothetical protein
VFAVVLCAAALYAQGVGAPKQMAVEGAGELPLAGEARRADLLGTADLYTVAIYSNVATERNELASVNAAKAFRIAVTYKDDLRRRVAVDWRRELVPRLEPQAMAHLQGAFAPVRLGDVISIQYAPEKGTSVRVNKAVAVSGAHHDLMLAFLDHWLGERPVSEELKQTLLRLP